MPIKYMTKLDWILDKIACTENLNIVGLSNGLGA